MADYKLTSANPWSTQVFSPVGTPTIGDRVFANGFTSNLDVDVTITSFHTEANAGITAVAGGNFSWTTARTITGNPIAGTTTCMTCSGTGSGTLIGNPNGGTVASANGFSKTTTGIVNIIGSGTGGSGTTAHGISINASAGAVQITGNGNGGNGNTSCGIDINTTVTVTITGNGTAAAGGIGVRSQGTGLVLIGGVAIGSTIAGAYAVLTLAATSNVVVQSFEFSSNNQVPVSGFVKWANSNPSVKVNKQNGSQVTLTDQTEIAGQVPAATDVRAGVSYLQGSITGSLQVPPKATVALGVATDNGVGTMSVAGTDTVAFLDEIQNSTHPIALKIKDNPSNDGIQAQFDAAFNH